MKIDVRFDGGRTQCSPDPAKVYVGDRVTWECTTTGARLLIWRFYFTGPHPFGHALGSAIDFRSKPPPIGQLIVVDTPPIVQRGDYKYGIEVVDAHTGQVLGDDDPYLHVF